MIVEFEGIYPKIGQDTKVFDTAFVSGDVTLGDFVSVWPGAAVRGDSSHITVGSNTNIQDCAVLHTTKEFPLSVGKNVTIGHGAILHGCTVEDDVTVGMGAIILDGAFVGKGSTVAAGTLVPPGKTVEAGKLAVGNPYKVIRDISEQELKINLENNETYVKTALKYKGHL